MDEKKQSLETLQDIKRMMERSSKFISLSGWSGISAGICALIGAWLANIAIKDAAKLENQEFAITHYFRGDSHISTTLLIWLIAIGIGTFIAAFLSAFLFTFLRSRKNNLSLWNSTTTRLLWNFLIPLLVGGVFLLRMIQLNQYYLIAPGCLVFYGLALVNASKYTLGEIRFLGYGQIILGLANLWLGRYGLYFWAAGFGLLHIIYGTIMWWKYERGNK